MSVDINQINNNHMYTVSESANILGVKEQTVRLYLTEQPKKLIGTKDRSGRWKIRGKELLRFLNNGSDGEEQEN